MKIIVFSNLRGIFDKTNLKMLYISFVQSFNSGFEIWREVYLILIKLITIYNIYKFIFKLPSYQTKQIYRSHCRSF